MFTRMSRAYDGGVELMWVNALLLPVGFLTGLALTRSVRLTLLWMGFLALYSLAFLAIFLLGSWLFY